jgi:hypothetical protein
VHDANLHVQVGAKLKVSCEFLLPGKMDQLMDNREYRYAVLDRDGNQVDNALTIRTVLRKIALPKSERSVVDDTDAVAQPEKLKSGEDYYFVVSVRNRIGLAKFKAP